MTPASLLANMPWFCPLGTPCLWEVIPEITLLNFEQRIRPILIKAYILLQNFAENQPLYTEKKKANVLEHICKKSKKNVFSYH